MNVLFPGCFLIWGASFGGPCCPPRFVFAETKPARQWTPRADGDAQFLRGRNMLALNIALDKGILKLQRRNPLAALLFGQCLRPRHIPRRNIRESDVANFSCLHEGVE